MMKSPTLNLAPYFKLILVKTLKFRNIPAIFLSLLITTAFYLFLVSQTRINNDENYDDRSRPTFIKKNGNNNNNFFRRVNIPAAMMVRTAPVVLPNYDNEQLQLQSPDRDDNNNVKIDDDDKNDYEQCKKPIEACSWPVHLKSGYGTGELPVICWQHHNALRYFNGKEPLEMLRGVHAVAIRRENPWEIAYQLVFDTYSNDDDLANFLLYNLKDGDILLLASHDDMQSGLHDFVRNILKHFGSKTIARVDFRDAFVMVGQKGAEEGTALEMLRQKRASEDYPPHATLTGCFNPLEYAPLKPFPPEHILRLGETLLRDGVMPNCGLQLICPSTTLFPVSIKTGSMYSNGPELCIDNHLAFHPSHKKGSRGFNLAIYDPEQRSIISADSFDPHIYEPTRMMRFFDSVEGDNILFGVIHEDASPDDMSEELLSRFGATIGAQLHAFSTGFFIAQRNSSSLAFESVRHYYQSEEYVPEPVEISLCLPLQMRNLRLLDVNRGVQISELLDKMSPKYEFCEKYPGSYGDLCSQPFQLTSSFHRPDMFSFTLPIFVMSGSDHRALARTLETLIGQNFLVDFDLALKIVCASHYAAATNFEELEELTNVFGFRLVLFDSETFDSLYEECLKHAVEITSSLKEDWFAFIEPGVELGPDFFNFLHQLIPAVANVSGAGISGWNRNSYENDPVVDRREDKAYFTETSILPSPCYLANVRYMVNAVLPNFRKCCHGRRYTAWQTFRGAGSFAYPEISRCFKMPQQCSHQSATVARNIETSSNVDADYDDTASCHELYLRNAGRRTVMRLVTETINLVGF